MSKRLGLVVVLLLQFHCVTVQSQNAATQQTERRKTSTPSVAIFRFLIPQEETKGCRSIALWTFWESLLAKLSLILEQGQVGSQSVQQNE